MLILSVRFRLKNPSTRKNKISKNSFDFSLLSSHKHLLTALRFHRSHTKEGGLRGKRVHEITSRILHDHVSEDISNDLFGGAAVTGRGRLALCEGVYDFQVSRGFRYLLPRVRHHPPLCRFYGADVVSPFATPEPIAFSNVFTNIEYFESRSATDFF